jgi:hypothetical protein
MLMKRITKAKTPDWIHNNPTFVRDFKGVWSNDQQRFVQIDENYGTAKTAVFHVAKLIK